MEYFETKTTINMATFRELRKHSVPRGGKIYLAISLAIGLVCVIGLIQGSINGNIHQESGSATIMGFTAVIALVVTPAVFLIRLNSDNKLYLARIQESTGTASFDVVTSFTEDNIKLHNLNSGGTVYMDYDVIVRFAETENLYVLYTKKSQFVLADKIKLIQEQKSEEFLHFIKDKCKNLK